MSLFIAQLRDIRQRERERRKPKEVKIDISKRPTKWRRRSYKKRGKKRRQ